MLILLIRHADADAYADYCHTLFHADAIRYAAAITLLMMPP